jgi:hypothetical protein
MVVSLLMVMVLGFVVTVRMELRRVTNSQNLVLARANAKVGLAIAISQLQKYAGADQRITAPATTVYPYKDVTRGTGELYDDAMFGYRNFAQTSTQRSYLNRVETYLVPNERDQWNQAVTEWWLNSGNPRNPHWVGVYDSSLRVDRATNPFGAPSPLSPQRYEEGGQPTFGEFKRDQLPVWLVSGNERLSFDPNTATSYPAGYQTPDVSLPAPALGNDVIELVSTGSAADPADSVDGLPGRVRVMKQPIEENGVQVGAYAYWVGDESTKANFAVFDPYANAAPGSVEYRNRLQVPQRLGWERMEGFSVGGADPNNPDLRKVTSVNQIPLALADTGDEVNAAFHHLTSSSKSLLTDTALGGLKKDLTRYLEDGQGLTDSQSIPNPDLYDPQDPRFAAWGGSNSGFPVDSSTEGLPFWGQVRQWHQTEAGGPSGLTPGEYAAPVLSYLMLHTGMTYDPDTQLLHWHWAPALMLWNPYGNQLNSATYEVEIQVSPNFWNFNVVNVDPDLAELQQDSGAEWDERPVGPESSPGVRQVVRSFRSPQANPDFAVGDPLRNYWPIITPGNHSYYIYEGAGSRPHHYNIGGRGPFPWDDTFADGTTDGFGRYYYNLRPAPGMAGRVRDPDASGRSPLNNTISPPFSDRAGPLGNSGGNNGKNWNNGMRFAPMHPATDGVNSPPYATKLRFRFTASFDPGQTRFFSLTSNHVAWDPIAGNAVTLQADFDPGYPGSVHFPVLQVVNGPSTAANLRFNTNVLASNQFAPAVKITVNGDLITNIDEFAGEAQINDRFQGNDFRNRASSEFDDDGDGEANNREGDGWASKLIDFWRPVHDLNDLLTDSGFNYRETDTGHTLAPLWGYGQHFFTPLTAAGSANHFDLHNNVPVFSRFNFSGTGAARHPLMDRLRDRFGVNNRNHLGNSEGMTRLDFYSSYSKASTPRWDNNQADNTSGFVVVNYRDDASDTYEPISSLIMRHGRRPSSNVLSLGQFQQINLSPYTWQQAFPVGNSWAGVYNDREAIAGIHSRQPGVSKDWHDGLVPRQAQVLPNSMADTVNGTSQFAVPLGPIEVPANSMLDMAYLLNENIWDRYVLSTIPDTVDLLSPLPNSRHRFEASAYQAGAELKSFDRAAAHITNHGALNVNSTSVEAWKAILSAFRDLDLGGNPAETAPVARTLDPFGQEIDFTFSGIDENDIGATATNKGYENVLNGFRYLDDEMIETLSERIVDEIRLRGPFYSMGDFVNRRLNAPQGSNQSGSAWHTARTRGWIPNVPTPVPNNYTDSLGRSPMNNFVDFISPDYDPFIGLHGLSGALQRAIDVSGINGGVNHPDLGPDGNGLGNRHDRIFTPKIRNSNNQDVQRNNEFTSSGVGGNGNIQLRHTTEPSLRSHLDTEHYAGAAAGEVGFLLDGLPGFITQGDLLSMLGPALTARGDTFLIRSYGEHGADSSGTRVWLEAVVQRVVDPVDPDVGDPYRPTSLFGRRFEIVSLRWLSNEEI